MPCEIPGGDMGRKLSPANIEVDPALMEAGDLDEWEDAIAECEEQWWWRVALNGCSIGSLPLLLASRAREIPPLRVCRNKESRRDDLNDSKPKLPRTAP